MPRYVPLNVPRNIGLQVVQFLGGFAFSEMAGNVFMASGVKLPIQIANFMKGAATPLNAKVGHFLQAVVTNETKTEELLFLQRMSENGFKGSEAKELYNGNWQAARKLMDDKNKEYDAKGLAKEIDCSEIQAGILLKLYNRPTEIALEIEKSNIIGIVVAGLTTLYFPVSLPITNPFLERLAYGVIGQVIAEVTKTALPHLTSKISFWANTCQKSSAVPNENSPLLNGISIQNNDVQSDEDVPGESTQNEKHEDPTPTLS